MAIYLKYFLPNHNLYGSYLCNRHYSPIVYAIDNLYDSYLCNRHYSPIVYAIDNLYDSYLCNQYCSPIIYTTIIHTTDIANLFCLHNHNTYSSYLYNQYCSPIIYTVVIYAIIMAIYIVAMQPYFFYTTIINITHPFFMQSILF